MVALFCVIFAAHEDILTINHKYLGYETIRYVSFGDVAVGGMDNAGLGLWYTQA